MISINGGIFGGTKGRKSTNRNGVGEKKKKILVFDERKVENPLDIESIRIDLIVGEVNISVSSSSEIETHFYGEVETEGEAKFSVQVANKELKIAFKITDKCYKHNLKLDVVLPKKIFFEISARTLSGNIALGKNVSAYDLNLQTINGNVETDAEFADAYISTNNGNVNVNVAAQENLWVEISTMNGDVVTTFNNVRLIIFYANSMYGKVKNSHNCKNGYLANVEILVMKGDVTIK